MNIYITLPKKAEMPTHNLTFKWGQTFIVYEKVRDMTKLMDVKYIRLRSGDRFALEAELRDYMLNELIQLNDVLKSKLVNGEIA